MVPEIDDGHLGILHMRPSIVEDTIYVARNLREEDREECVAAAGLPPEISIPLSVRKADVCRTICAPGGNPMGLYGVTGAEGTVGGAKVASVWMVCTPEILAHQKAFLRRSRRCVDKFFDDWDVLVNFADVRNEVHHNWLRWCGFTIFGIRHAYGYHGMPFYQFAKIRPDVERRT